MGLVVFGLTKGMEMELTQKEIEAFEGLDQSYKDMMNEVDKIAPRCHMRPMFLDGGDGPHGEAWFECAHCGHTQDIN